MPNILLTAKFFPHIEDIGSDFVDLAVFDGASNVQKAGHVLGAKYPRMSVIQGIEHIASLFFNDYSKVYLVKVLVKFYKVVYSFFGSGSRHACYAMFMDLAFKSNNRKTIGLIRAADTRMGGHFIALLRLLRLKEPLQQCIHSKSFVTLKLKAADPVVAVLKRDTFWEMVVTVLRPTVPIMRILRMADSKSHAMDKVAYCIRKTDILIQSKAATLDALTSIKKFKDINGMMMRVTSTQNLSDRVMAGIIDTDDEDNDEGGDSSSDDNSASSNQQDAPPSISSEVIQIWNNRRSAILNSYAIAAWMTSPVREIMEDAASHTSDDRDVVVKLLVKLFLDFGGFNGDEEAFEKARTDLIDQFWEQYNDFTTKTKKFDGQLPMWRSIDLLHDRTPIWHKKNTYPRASLLGHFACIVSSKPLGIGSAERCWGEVKQITKGQRVNLGSNKTNMLTTIQGKYRTEKARIMKESKEEEGCYDSFKWWDDSDFETLGLDRYGLDIERVAGIKKDMRVFHGWIEDWEVELVSKNDPVVKQRFLRKYGGLSFLNPDQPKEGVYTIDNHELSFNKSRGNKGWHLVVYNESYDRITNPDATDEWPIKPNTPEESQSEIMFCIVEYYKKSNPDPNIKVIEEYELDSDDD